MIAPVDDHTLSSFALFRGLAPDELAALSRLLHPRTVPADSNLIQVEQPGEVAYIIRSGTVKIHVEQSDGTNVILAILGPGEPVGEMSIVDSLGRSASVTTIEETLIWWIDRAAFQESLTSMPVMALNLLRIMSRRLRLANARIESLATLDVHGRIARQILAFAQEYGEPDANGEVVIPFRLTQSDLSDLVGATRVRVNQALVYYKAQGYISVDQNYRITVHSQEALRQRAE